MMDAGQTEGAFDRRERRALLAETQGVAVEHRTRSGGGLAYVLLAAMLPALTTTAYIVQPRFAREPLPIGFALDDSWIHAMYARTIVEGRPFEYRPGVRSNGTTAPLYALVVAGVAAFTHEYFYTLHGVNIALMALFGSLLYAVLRQFGLPAIAAVVGVGLIAISWPLPWGGAAGMEIPLTLVLAALLVWLHQREAAGGRTAGWLTSPVLALLCMTRPEFCALWPLLELDRGVIRLRTPAAERRPRPLPRFLLRITLFATFFAPYAVFNYQCNGTFVVNTLQTSVGDRSFLEVAARGDYRTLWSRFASAGPRAVRQFVNTVRLDDNLPLVLLSVVGAVLWLRPRAARPRAFDSLIVPLIALAVPFCIGVVTGELRQAQAQRTLHGEITFLLVGGVLGLHALGSLAQGAALGATVLTVGRRYAAVLVLGIGVCLAWLNDAQRWRLHEYGLCVKNIQDCQVHLGHWVAEHVPDGETVATCDIGAIAFFGNRPVLDTQGLIDPDMLPFRDPGNGLAEELRRRGVRWAIIFPNWHPDLAGSPLFTERIRVIVEDNVVCYGDLMIVYEAAGPPSDSAAAEKSIAART